MPKTSKYDAILTIVELWKKAAKETVPMKGSQNKFDERTFESKGTGDIVPYVPSDFVLLHPGLLSKLKKREREVVIAIISNLKTKNCLWHFDGDEERDKRAISKLIKTGLLLKTQVSNIFIVNPWLIRRGTIEITIVATFSLLEKVDGKITPEIITDLKKPSNTVISGFYELMRDEIS